MNSLDITKSMLSCPESFRHEYISESTLSVILSKNFDSSTVEDIFRGIKASIQKKKPKKEIIWNWFKFNSTLISICVWESDCFFLWQRLIRLRDPAKWIQRHGDLIKHTTNIWQTVFHLKEAGL